MSTAVAATEGRPGYLTPDQEEKLRELWTQLFACYDAADLAVKESGPAAGDAEGDAPSSPSVRRRSTGLFRWRSNEQAPPNTDTTTANKDLSKAQLVNKYLGGKSQAEIRQIIGGFAKIDHPDALVLRFLRARKWVVQDALSMLLAVLHWRHFEAKVDDDIMFRGEAGALNDATTGDADAKKQGEGFMKQYRIGKGFTHGVDKAGRPISYVMVRKHFARDQPAQALERFIVHVIETSRLLLEPPFDTVTVIFDLSGFSLSNLDYHPIKFIIQCFERNYPECLASLLIHNAPWVFQGVWKIIHGWLDPVVAQKVHFTNYRSGLEEYVEPSRLIKYLEGDEDWEFKYEEPVAGENDTMKDATTRDQLIQERNGIYEKFETLTRKWIEASSDDERKSIHAEREEVAKHMRENYWKVDPYIRARSIYDRQGFLLPDGTVNWYGDKGAQKQNGVTNGTAPAVQTEKPADAAAPEPAAAPVAA